MAEHWLCIRIPQLPLEIFSRSGNEEQALAVCDHGQRVSVLFCNATAAGLGIRPGMAVSAARALARNLIVYPRDGKAEREALQGLAAWAWQFSSRISLYPPYALLLEIQGSLTLFGGRTALLGSIQSGLSTLGYQTTLAAAPTPLAAFSMAACSNGQRVESVQGLPSVLASLPLSVLEWKQAYLDRLQGMGIRCLGDLFKLPRDGLARRFGPDSVLYLDRMLGRVTDPQTLFEPPSCFRRRLQLPWEVEHAGALAFALQRLLLELCGWMQGQAMALQVFDIFLWHRQGRKTELHIGVHQKSRDAGYLSVLLRERLESLELPQAVLEVELHADHFLRLDGQSMDLFDNSRQQDQVDLLDRLRARLGAEAVRGLSAVAEHRPEYAWCYSEPGQVEQNAKGCQRPLWLLPVPRKLDTREGWPCLHGKLKLQAGRERIESGWWDGQALARDYFIAESPSGSCYWIYRELAGERRWFLQGVFE